jgi:hypothetical protein
MANWVSFPWGAVQFFSTKATSVSSFFHVIAEREMMNDDQHKIIDLFYPLNHEVLKAVRRQAR